MTTRQLLLPLVLICLSGSAFGQATCTRAELRAATDSYIAAQTAGDISKLAFAIDGKYRYVHTLSVNLNPNAPSPQATDDGGLVR